MERKRRYIVILLGILVYLSGCGNDTQIMVSEETGTIESSTNNQVITENTEADNPIFVYVCGEVQNPGVYEVTADARVCDVIDKAGGFSEYADAKALNLADHVEDAEKIYVPNMQEDRLQEEDSQEEDGLLDLNKATKEQLMTLPGIGETKADLILEYRETKGPFQSVEELMEIQGIKERTLNQIKASVKI